MVANNGANMAKAKTYDVHTRKGRAELDKAVAARLHAEHGRMRGEIAERLGADPRAVSAALLRLVKAGAARRSGPTRSPLYTKAVAA
jgi:hypothetical protein